MILTRNGGKLSLLSQVMARIEMEVGLNSMGVEKSRVNMNSELATLQ